MESIFAIEGYRDPNEKQGSKKKKIVPPSQIIDFFGTQPQIISFTTSVFEDLVIYVAKVYWPLSSVENPWLWCLVL
jgi:hypothetical protein